MHLVSRHGTSDGRGREVGLERASRVRKIFVSRAREVMTDMQQMIIQAVFECIPD